jgi:hypothetical protein
MYTYEYRVHLCVIYTYTLIYTYTQPQRATMYLRIEVCICICICINYTNTHTRGEREGGREGGRGRERGRESARESKRKSARERCHKYRESFLLNALARNKQSDRLHGLSWQHSRLAPGCREPQHNSGIWIQQHRSSVQQTRPSLLILRRRPSLLSVHCCRSSILKPSERSCEHCARLPHLSTASHCPPFLFPPSPHSRLLSLGTRRPLDVECIQKQ